MGELTPGTQLSMGSAKRLYVLMAGFYTHWASRTSAVKSRHRSRDLHLHVSGGVALRHLVYHLKLYHVEEDDSTWSTYASEAEGLSSARRWEFTLAVQLHIPMTVTAPLGFKPNLVHVKICERAAAFHEGTDGILLKDCN